MVKTPMQIFRQEQIGFGVISNSNEPTGSMVRDAESWDAIFPFFSINYSFEIISKDEDFVIFFTIH